MPPADPASERFFAHINDVADTVDIRLSVDTRHVVTATAEAFLRGLEKTLVDAVEKPGAIIGSA